MTIVLCVKLLRSMVKWWWWQGRLDFGRGWFPLILGVFL